MTIQKRVNTLARKLINRGVKPLRIDPETEFTDTAIWVTGSIYVQVGYDYVVVFKNKVDQLAMYPCDDNISSLMSALQKAILDGKAD